VRYGTSSGVETVCGKAAAAGSRRSEARRLLEGSARRALDIAASLFGLILLAPVFCVVALLIRAEGGGPALFLQERVGRGFRPFRIYKFRTMAAGARKGGYVTVEGDERITPLGRRLRRYKIDELPQLLNVLKGEMSLVGPRPEMAMYVELFRSDYERLLRDRPGITDPASLCFAHEERLLAQYQDPAAEYVARVLPEKIGLALKYAEERTLLSDLKVIFRTLLKVSARG